MERTPVAQAVQEAMPREAVDAAMVQHITDASQFMRVWESPPVESLASFAARTLPEVAPVRAASGPDPFLSWLRAQGGVNFADKFDITGEANAIRSNRGGVFRKDGRGIDELAQAAEAEGWLPPGTVADVDGGTPQMRDMIQRAMQGERITPLAEQFASMESRAMAHADEMRAAEMEQRLQLLGVDPAPARGNVEVLQAYLDQHEPRLLAAALAEEAAARRSAALDDFPTQATRPPADAAPTPANRPQEASPADRPQEPALPPIEPGSGPDHATIQSVRTRANQVVTEAPDLVVGLTEDGQPITAREALERIRQEAQAGTEDTLGAAEAGLLDVAVQCALSLGG